jgi:HSP20 family protein
MAPRKPYIMSALLHKARKYYNMWRDREFGFGSLFEDIEREFAEAEEMMNRVFRTAKDIRPEDLAKNGYFYGYQLTVGPDGKPHVREFGNVRPSMKGLVAPSDTREPMVETAVDEKENMLRITAEMPGVTKQDVKVSVSEEQVTIHAEKGDKKYHTEIPVSVPLDDKSSKATYSNGILELKIKIKSPSKPKATEVKVD